ncbi:MAG: hypothetical protein Q8865_06170 [Bacillota bacterium]|nr:hypothetical protein [Bacillota bacterium]
MIIIANIPTKNFIYLLVFTLILSCFIGCSSKPKEDNTTDKGQDTISTQEYPDIANANQQNSTPSKDSVPSKDSTPSQTTSSQLNKSNNQPKTSNEKSNDSFKDMKLNYFDYFAKKEDLFVALTELTFDKTEDIPDNIVLAYAFDKLFEEGSFEKTSEKGYLNVKQGDIDKITQQYFNRTLNHPVKTDSNNDYSYNSTKKEYCFVNYGCGGYFVDLVSLKTNEDYTKTGVFRIYDTLTEEFGDGFLEQVRKDICSNKTEFKNPRGEVMPYKTRTLTFKEIPLKNGDFYIQYISLQ